MSRSRAGKIATEAAERELDVSLRGFPIRQSADPVVWLSPVVADQPVAQVLKENLQIMLLGRRLLSCRHLGREMDRIALPALALIISVYRAFTPSIQQPIANLP